MKRIGLAILACLYASTMAVAADGDGNYAVKGAGNGTCEAFVAAREDKTKAYYVFGGWLAGYLTAINQYAPDTFDITTWESIELLAALIDNHCRKNPDAKYHRIVNAIALNLRHDRQIERSPFVTATVDDRTVRIYRDTMRRVQIALAAAGHYDGNDDGDFGTATRKALESFQGARKITVTGLPDQVTLLTLLRPEIKVDIR